MFKIGTLVRAKVPVPFQGLFIPVGTFGRVRTTLQHQAGGAPAVMVDFGDKYGEVMSVLSYLERI